MKSPKKPTAKKSTKTTKAGGTDSKKTSLKPVDPKENKNWKSKLDEDEDDFDLAMDEFDDDLGGDFEDDFDDDDDRF
jgi:hypothetical protein